MTKIEIPIPDYFLEGGGFWKIGSIRYTPITLPYGVHWLSPESVETLRRAKEKAKAAEARHTKRGS